MGEKTYYVYITTNPTRTTLYIGITNALSRRLYGHYENRGKPKTFAGRYYCHNLIYYETFSYVKDALFREKQIKKWNRKKKEELIATMNPSWQFLNKDVMQF